MFMNLRTLDYDDELLDWFRHRPEEGQAGQDCALGRSRGLRSLASTLLNGTKIMGRLGDQSAALVGQRASPRPCQEHIRHGLLPPLQRRRQARHFRTHGLLSTVAFDFGEGRTMYALEGSIAVAGSSVKFLVDNFGFIESSSK